MKNNSSLEVSEDREKQHAPFPSMTWIPGGSFTMGSNSHYAEEAPAHEVHVEGFWMDVNNVTNEDFKKFIDSTNYITLAERPINSKDYPGAPLENLVSGSLVFKKPIGPVDMDDYQNWWSYVPGATWKNPEGPGSNLDGRWQHPVVQVAWEDAKAYAKWAGKEIATEAEWEFAARGGLENKIYAWGDDLLPNGKILANFWQGEFPWQNLNKEEGTSIAGSYPANAYGLHDMCGNVWEWTSDWYFSRYIVSKDKSGHRTIAHHKTKKEDSYDPEQPEIKIPRKVLKGGSYLCSENYCNRFRPAARAAQMIDSASCHIGFRCIVRKEIKNTFDFNRLTMEWNSIYLY